MNCQKCGRRITDIESHPFQGQTLCDDCYMKAISTEKECDPWATYLSKHEMKGGQENADALNESERRIYDFIKSNSRATRQQVMAKFKLSEDDLEPQLHVLMHAELIKELGESDTMYLVPIPLVK